MLIHSAALTDVLAAGPAAQPAAVPPSTGTPQIPSQFNIQLVTHVTL